MNAESFQERYCQPREDENLKPRHQEAAGARASYLARGKFEDSIDSRSMTREVSMDFRQLSFGPDLQDRESGDIPVPSRETRQRTQRDERYIGQEESVYSSRLRSYLPAFLTRPKALHERQPPQQFGSFNNVEKFSRQPQAYEGTGRIIKSASEPEQIDERPEKIFLDCPAKERQSERNVRDLQRQLDSFADLARTLQTKIEQLESEKQVLESKNQRISDDLDAFIVKQQEMSFSQMPNSRWAPVEDRKVMADLDRRQKSMRNWARQAAASDISAIKESLNGSEIASLSSALEQVIVFQNRDLPRGLSPQRAPALLLNALLSHDIYTNIVEVPFFFLGREYVQGQLVHSPFRVGLEQAYNKGLASDEEEAHVWRSQTLRLHLPQLDVETSAKRKEMHEMTKQMIIRAAYQQTIMFLNGAARFLISDTNNELVDKLHSIYREAAHASFDLWTRRTKLECATLRGSMRGCPVFLPDSKDMIAHSSVDYEMHADRLEGRAISIILHPGLKVCGTDEGTDYDQGRVWIPAEVWLDGSVSTFD